MDGLETVSTLRGHTSGHKLTKGLLARPEAEPRRGFLEEDSDHSWTGGMGGVSPNLPLTRAPASAPASGRFR